MLLAYVFYLTFFLAWLAKFARWEEEKRHCLCACIAIDNTPSVTSNGSTMEMFSVAGAKGTKEHVLSMPTEGTDAKEQSLTSELFADYYGPFITNPWTKIGVCVLFVHT